MHNTGYDDAPDEALACLLCEESVEYYVRREPEDSGKLIERS